MEGVNQGQKKYGAKAMKRSRSYPCLDKRERIGVGLKRIKTVPFKLDQLGKTEAMLDNVVDGLNQNRIEDGKDLNTFRLSSVPPIEVETKELDEKKEDVGNLDLDGLNGT